MSKQLIKYSDLIQLKRLNHNNQFSFFSLSISFAIALFLVSSFLLSLYVFFLPPTSFLFYSLYMCFFSFRLVFSLLFSLYVFFLPPTSFFSFILSICIFFPPTSFFLFYSLYLSLYFVSSMRFI
jgi:hypothetical protein